MLFGKHINRYYLRYSYALLIGLVALVAVDYIQLIVPRLYQTVVNGINDGYVVIDGEKQIFDMTFLLEEVCKPFIFIIISMVFGRFIWRICFFGTALKVETDLRERMFDHCKDLSQQFYQVNKVGNLMSLFTNDLETVQDCFGSGVLMLCDAVFLGALAIFRMSQMNIWLTLFSMIPMVFLLGIGLILSKYLRIKWETRQEAFSSLSDFSQESFGGIAVIKAFVKEAKELSAFRKLNKENEDANVEYTRLSVKLNISVTLFVESVICVILGYGGYLVYKHVFNAGQLVEFIGYFTAVVWPVMAVSQLIEMRSRGRASLDRISKLLEEKIDVFDKANVSDCDVLKGDITFNHLSFRYPGGSYDVLKDICLEIKAGDNIGIVGRVGCGKTTLVDLILRTYNIPDGTIFLDGKDINEISIKTVRKHSAYVPQDNFLFSDTIRNNIAFASDSDSTEEIEEAADYADVHNNIRDFPEKYMTVLGERGVTVSGGQKQRISIARALMKNAAILILDDSVSAVDVKTEKKILTNLKEIRKGKTTILIAHRITTVKEMDKVVFMDDGRIVAFGTHEELYDTCPDYRNMVELQKLDDEASAMGGNK